MQLYANIGQDIARTAYDWDPQAALVPLASATDSRLYFYTREGLLFNDAADAGAFVPEQLRNGNTCVEILLKKDSTAGLTCLKYPVFILIFIIITAIIGTVSFY